MLLVRSFLKVPLGWHIMYAAVTCPLHIALAGSSPTRKVTSAADTFALAKRNKRLRESYR